MRCIHILFFVLISFSSLTADIIIVDNRDAGFSRTGSWPESGAPDEYAGSSLYSATVDSTATWTPTLSTAGTYEVFVWYTGSAQYDRDTDADYTILHADGTTAVAIDQNQGSGAWVSLGVYTFQAGNSSSVTLLRDANAVGTTSADAMKFVLLGSGTLPNTAPVADAGPDRTAQVAQVVTITGSGTDTDGSIVSYEWKQGTTVIATTASFDYTPDTVGDQTLTLTVTDNEGAVATDSMILTVTDSVVPLSETIVDNRDAEFTQTGSWPESGAPDEYAGSSLYSATVDSTATWTPTLSTAGTYEVFVWYTGSAQYDRDTDADYTILHADGTTAVAIDQNQGSGAWVSLGVYTFQAGNSSSVTLLRDANAVGTTSADAMKFVLLDNSIESVNITAPLSGYIQSGNSIVTSANATITQNSWGVKFILDEGSLGETVFFDMSEPYDAVFENLPTGEHTIDVYIVDESGTAQTGNMMHDHVHHIGTGGEIIVALGDSITYAYNDDVSIDDVSDDGRNSGGGFEPILNNLLTLETNQPHSIINEGISGNTSADGLSRLPQVINAHPEATRYLIMFGTNDANPSSSLPIETFRTNMQQIIDILKSAGKIPILAKAPRVMSDYFTDPTYVEQGIDPEDGTRNIIIRSYNDIIDELVATNNITVIPPDFYTYFRDTFGSTYSVSVQDGYVDNFHPDNLGYNAMAELWRDVLIAQ